MISSPLLSELVKTLSNVSDQSVGLANTIRSVRTAESDFSRALDDLVSAPDPTERHTCIVRRNRAMQDLIAALQALQQFLEREVA